MTTVLMKTVVTNAGWTNGITMAMATMKKATLRLLRLFLRVNGSWMCFTGWKMITKIVKSSTPVFHS